MHQGNDGTALGLIAGAGSLPVEVARLLRGLGYSLFAIGFDGLTDRALESEVEDARWVLLGKLDAMTRESIRSDLQRLWMQERPTVMFVTHSIEEAVQLSSRVAVITPRPGQIERVLEINLPYPRDFDVKNTPEFSAYVRETQEIFRGYGVI